MQLVTFLKNEARATTEATMAHSSIIPSIRVKLDLVADPADSSGVTGNLNVKVRS